MATIIIDGQNFAVEDGTRLINGIEDAGIDILHRCGGNAKCVTCKITFNSGEPDTYHPNEQAKLEDGNNMGDFRLACQISCAGDMDVNVLMRLSDMEKMDSAGSRCADEIPA